MLKGLLVLIGCNLAGVFIVEVTGITVPAAVVGMILLLIGLFVARGVPDDIGKAGDGLLHYLGLIFVPAGVGIVNYLDLLADKWAVILVASVGATVVTLVVSGWLFQFLSGRKS